MALWVGATLIAMMAAGFAHEFAHALIARAHDPTRTYTIDLGKPVSRRRQVARQITVRMGRPAGVNWGFWVNAALADTDADGLIKILRAGPAVDAAVGSVGVLAAAIAAGFGSRPGLTASVIVAGVGWHMFGLNLGHFRERADGYWIAELRSDPDTASVRLRERTLAHEQRGS